MHILEPCSMGYIDYLMFLPITKESKTELTCNTVPSGALKKKAKEYKSLEHKKKTIKKSVFKEQLRFACEHR